MGVEGQRYIEEHWGFQVPVPADQQIAQNGRDLQLLPREADSLKDQLGSMFVRAGMRVANLHKGHYYLTQQAIAMWSHLMSSPRLVDLTWAQTQALFRHESIQLERPQVLGEVICWHDSWPLCRGILRGENNLESFLPRSLRGIDVRRLVPEPSGNRSAD